jgi:hypothetical protein
VLAVPTAAEQPARILAGMVVADARRAGVALEDLVISTATASPPFVAMSRPNARLTQADTAEAAATLPPAVLCALLPGGQPRLSADLLAHGHTATVSGEGATRDECDPSDS